MQLQMLLLERGYRGRSLLSTAALEGDKASFETIFGALKTGLSSDQVRYFHVLLKTPIHRFRQLHVMIIHYRNTRYCT